MSDSHDHSHGFTGPKCWILTLIAGLIIGALVSFVLPASWNHGAHSDAASHGTIVADGDGESVHLPPTPQQEHADPSQNNQTNDHASGTEPEHSEDTHPAGSETATDHDPTEHAAHAHGPAPAIPIWLVLPFALLLGSIALMPFINGKFWHSHFPDFAFFLGGVVAAYYFFAFKGDEPYSHGMSYGLYQLKHAALEYYQFIALVGGLFVVSGGVLVDLKGKGGPKLNVALLGFGAVIANIVGTTGASMLLIRPFMRVNAGRLKPIHVVFFIFIVSNCGGALTPIGDPPLYLGFLKGVPFFWTAEHMLAEWAFVITLLLSVFAVIDWKIGPANPTNDDNEVVVEPAKFGLRLKGAVGIICLGLMILGVFIDPILKAMGMTQFEGLPVGATFQILVAIMSYKLAPREILHANEFDFFPVKEVGLLFLGIFTTMMPALGYLSTHGQQLGIDSVHAFYYLTGALSGVLDNAPTYLNFLQIAFGNEHFNMLAPENTNIDPASVHAFLFNEDGTTRHTGAMILSAISTGAVFFGAMTYIGNGPNFMVRAIAESSGLRMPSFFGYMARAIILLLPVLVLHHLVFFLLIG
ncbi:MAG: sodium:proton antiporter [Phycisphaeraceae bacterium]|nr:sodium:proton antiporter [Phycisphaerales bacterium]MCB9861093.1 sodium:proton antiporter [Phycisphaeraceae bacterium]